MLRALFHGVAPENFSIKSDREWQAYVLGDAFARDLAPILAEAGYLDRERAIAEILRRHRVPIVAFARRLLGDAARADEVAQDVFVRLWERSERFDSTRGTLRAFLLALTHGRALDVSRADTARARREERDHTRRAAPRDGADTPIVARSVADALNRVGVRADVSEHRVADPVAQLLGGRGTSSESGDASRREENADHCD